MTCLLLQIKIYYYKNNEKGDTNRIPLFYCLYFFLHIISPVYQAHIALLQQGVMQSKSRFYAMGSMTLRCNLLIIPKNLFVIRMRTLFDNDLGTFRRTLATKIGNTLFGNKDIHIVFGLVVVRNHRHNGTDLSFLGH